MKGGPIPRGTGRLTFGRKINMNLSFSLEWEPRFLGWQLEEPQLVVGHGISTAIGKVTENTSLCVIAVCEM
jgi:hypothetical protein